MRTIRNLPLAPADDALPDDRKVTHGRLVDGAGTVLPLRSAVDGLEGVTLEFGFIRDGIDPVSHLASMRMPTRLQSCDRRPARAA